MIHGPILPGIADSRIARLGISRGVVVHVQRVKSAHKAGGDAVVAIHGDGGLGMQASATLPASTAVPFQQEKR